MCHAIQSWSGYARQRQQAFEPPCGSVRPIRPMASGPLYVSTIASPSRAREVDAAFRVTTREQFLPRAHFDRSIREIVNRAAIERGRRIYAIELRSQEIMAVLSYHLHDSPARPLLITALGTRADVNAPPDLHARSLALVWLLKQYAHAISNRTKRGGYVDMDAANRPEVIAVLRQLGFRDAPRVTGFSPSGRHLRQDAAGGR